MALTCPKCAATIPQADINVATDVAMCRACGTMHKAADLVHDDVLDQTEHEAATALSGPQPAGVSWRDDGQTLMVRAGVGSRVVAGVMSVFAAFWTFGALMVLADPIDVLINGRKPVPPLGPDPTPLEVHEHEAAQMMQRTMDLGDWVMGGVLLVICLLFWLLALTALRAKVTIRVRPDEGSVVKGAFPFYIRRRFDPARVTGVIEQLDTNTTINGKHPSKIVIKAEEEIGFGGFMPEARRKWVAAILQVNLMRRR